MLFASYGFIAFISILFIVYYLIPKKHQWKLLLFASYVFYLFAGPKYILYIVFTTVSTYIISLRIDKLNQTQAQYLAKHKKDLSRADKREYRDMMKYRMRRWLVACLLLNFGILAVVKYSNFAIANLNAISRAFGGQGQLSF